MPKRILLVCGGDGSEHSISISSAQYLETRLSQNPDLKVLKVCLHEGSYADESGRQGFFEHTGKFNIGGTVHDVDAVVPCFHGIPGETGQFQSYLEMLGLEYIGCDSQASINCFNKITTKLYLSALDIPNSPFMIIGSKDDESIRKAQECFDKWQNVYIKAACQGSSIGCYHVKKAEDLKDSIFEAFYYSNSVIMEKTIENRELEVATYEFDGKIHAAGPGEILTPENDDFYTFDQKYAKSSATTTELEAKGLTSEQSKRIRELAIKAFKGLRLRDLSRIDFFLSSDGEVMINEINTFPGMTPISMFPKLLEHNGHDMTKFLTQCIDRAISRKGQKKLI